MKQKHAKLSDLAQHLDCTARTVNSLAADGIIPREARGSYDLDACRVAYIRHLRKQAQGAGDGKLTEERTQKTRVERQLKQVQLMVAEKELIPRAEVLSEFLSRISAVKTGLMAQHKVIPPLLVGLEPRDMADVIRKANLHLLDRFCRKGGITRLCGKDSKKPVVARRNRRVAPAGGDDGEPVRRQE